MRTSLWITALLAFGGNQSLAAEGDVLPKGVSPCLRAADIVPVEPTYVPNEPFFLEFRPRSGDWPSTPTIQWRVGPVGTFVGEQVQEFVLGEEAEDFVQIIVGAFGESPEPTCEFWTTTTYSTTVRRFDATPTPTPTVTPTFTPTMTPGTPRPTCTPVPLTTCLDRITSPTRGPGGTVPSSFLIKIESPAEFLFLSGPGGTVDTPEIAPGVFEAKGLTPGSTYLLWWLCDRESCDPLLDTKGLQLNVVETSEETPTISPTPTVTSSPTTATITPTPSVITPTPTPTSISRGGEGWILSSSDSLYPPRLLHAGSPWSAPVVINPFVAPESMEQSSNPEGVSTR